MNEVKHLAIILDGNRRFAKRLNLNPWEGHEQGAKNIGRLLKWCEELNIKEVTLYILSVENFKRSRQELHFIMELLRKYFEELKKKNDIHEKKVKIRFLGRLEMFPEDLRAQINDLIESTKEYDQYAVNFCAAYGGRQEISDAFKKMASDVFEGELKPEEIDDHSVKKYLYMSEEPELIIRTGGEKRLSGFLLYQCSYSELFFVDKYWPEFRKEDLEKCLEDFKKRKRNFGK